MSDTTAHILIVDDDPAIRRMFQQLLTTSGYRVLAAATAEEALAYLDLVTPDLILMDFNLPGMSGLEAIQRVKADTSKPFISVIMITARGDQTSKVEVLDAGADDFIVKPVELSELLARIRVMLRLQHSRRSLRSEQQKTELLLHLTRALGTTLDFDQLLTRFLNRLSDAVGAVRASIILLLDEQPRLYSSTRNGSFTPLSDILREGVAGWVLRNRKPLVIDDTRGDARWIAQSAVQQIVRSVAAMPILREERALGVVTLVHHTPGYFTDTHIDLLTSVAAQCAFAVENAELFQLTQRQKDLLERRAEELQRINQVSRHLAELMPPSQLLRLVAHLIHDIFGYPRVTMFLREDRELVMRAVAGDRIDEGWIGTRQPDDAGFAGWAAVHQEILSVGDIPNDMRGLLVGDSGARAVLAVPIVTARDVLGVLEVTSTIAAAFNEDDARLLGTLASQLGVALQNAQLFDNEQRRVRQLERVNSLSIAITAQLDATADLDVAAEAIATIFEAETCGIAVATPDQREPVRFAIYARTAPAGGQPRLALALPQLAAIELSAPDIIRDVAADPRLASVCDELHQAGITALVLAPLASGGRQIGVIALDATAPSRKIQFGHGERTLLETIASLITQVIENARLYREVEGERSTINAVLSGAADPILLIDSHDQLLLANRAAIERFQLGGGLGQPIAALELQPDLRAALGGGAAGMPPHEVTLPDGSTFSISVAPVQSSDAGLLGRVAVIQDITAIKELERREQERLRGVFRRYVSPQVVEEVLAGAGGFGEPAEREVVVLFADLRGYTSLTEGLPARVLVEQVLNRYLSAMTEVLYRHDGTIDKFLGDGIIGLFGVPIARPDDVQRSLFAAVEMQRAIMVLSEIWQRELGREIGMGIGIGYGRAVVGNIGSAQRLDYTVIGDVVNVASRLNGLAQAGEIVVSHQLVDALSPDMPLPGKLCERGRVALKGKQEPHLVYQVEYEPE
jgi:adenylate cyclase